MLKFDSAESQSTFSEAGLKQQINTPIYIRCNSEQMDYNREVDQAVFNLRIASVGSAAEKMVFPATNTSAPA